MEQQVGFLIEDYNIEQNYILVRPYLNSFTKPPSAYPLLNITLTNLDLNKDISEQIGQICAPNIRNIQQQEVGEVLPSIENTLSNLLNQHVTMPLSSIPHYLPPWDATNVPRPAASQDILQQLINTPSVQVAISAANINFVA